MAACCTPSGQDSTDSSLVAYRKSHEPLYTTTVGMAPTPQVMARRTPSACEKYNQYQLATSIACNLTINDRIAKLVQPKEVYGVVCEPRIQEVRLNKDKFPDSVDKKAVFLVCPEGINSEEALKRLKQVVENKNKQAKNQNLLNEEYFVCASKLEYNGRQARFCLEVQEPNEVGIEYVEFIIFSPNSSNGDNDVFIVLLSDVPYNLTKSQMLNIIKESADGILISLPKLKDIDVENWQLAPEHDWDHYLGKNDTTNIGLCYKYGATRPVPTYVNTARKMDFNTEEAKTFRTSIQEDTVKEIITASNPSDKDNAFTKFFSKLSSSSPLSSAKKIQTAIPYSPEDTIFVQQESDLYYGSLDSTKMLAQKSCSLRADVTHLNLTDAQKTEFGIYSVQGSNQGSNIDIFDAQKLVKSFYNLISQITEDLWIASNSYKLDGGDVEIMERELMTVLQHVTEMGHGVLSVLQNSQNNPETRCEFENARLSITSTQQIIINSINQFYVHNGQPTITIADVLKLIENDVQTFDLPTMDNGSVFQDIMENSLKKIKDYGLDQNKSEPKKRFNKETPFLKTHIEKFSSCDRLRLSQKSISVLPLYPKPKPR